MISKNQAEMRMSKPASTLWSIALASFVALMFLGAPLKGAFSWADAPRHALNGAFVLDLLRALPGADPVAFAYDYYSRYPALTILFYPPLFSFVLAGFYATFGVSQETAIFTMFLCQVVLALGTFHVANYWLPPLGAFGAATMLTAFPEIAFWSRQVMLEIPALAVLTWSAYYLIKHLRCGTIKPLYASIALLVLAHYVKLSVAFMILPYAAVLLRTHGFAILKNRHLYIIGALASLGISPLVLMTIYFGSANVQSVTGIADSSVSRLSVDGWLWYLRALPAQVGWPALVAVLALVAVPLLKRRYPSGPKGSTLLLILWVVVGYIFFSSIDLKDPRLDLYIFPPLAIGSALAIYSLFSARPRLAGFAVISVALATLAITLTQRPVAYVTGYRDVASFVSAHAPVGSRVLFSGYRDGAFIFSMREREDRRDLTVLRADKMLLRIAVRRELGVVQATLSEDEIAELLNSSGVHYVVAQPDFWIDLEQMARLQKVLLSDRFTEVARFPLRSNYPALDKEAVVYKNLGEVTSGPVKITN